LFNRFIILLKVSTDLTHTLNFKKQLVKYYFAVPAQQRKLEAFKIHLQDFIYII